MRVTFWCFALVASLLACGGVGAQRRLEMDLAGDIPFAITNVSSVPLNDLSFSTKIDGRYRVAVMILDHAYGRPGPIDPGQTAKFAFVPAEYEVQLRAHVGGYGNTTVCSPAKLQLTGPTQIVLYDGPTPPANVATLPGFTVVTCERQDLKDKRIAAANAAAAQNRRDAARNECVRRLGSTNPSPGRIKATGKWKCILGGAYKGTDYVDLVQLADGRITATVSGSDRNSTWSGAVVGEDVNFRFSDTTASGGALKLDPSGRAMLGNGYTFTEGGECLTWTMTCTK